ncbi:MAG: (2Fe-2S)-binding protein [Oscillospiraceae bacterium]|nr:(2Fe-2S)-binding protein [Oscillospiraceae bacterium]
MRIVNHPILGTDETECTVTVYFEGRPIKARAGEPIAIALAAAGIKALRTTRRTHEPRGIYCAQGRCSDCMMIVNGRPDVRTCITPVEEGMTIEMQHGLVHGGVNDEKL